MHSDHKNHKINNHRHAADDNDEEDLYKKRS